MKIRLSKVPTSIIYWAVSMVGILFFDIHTDDWQVILIAFLMYAIGVLFGANEYTRGISTATRIHNEATRREMDKLHELFHEDPFTTIVEGSQETAS